MAAGVDYPQEYAFKLDEIKWISEQLVLLRNGRLTSKQQVQQDTEDIAKGDW